MGYLLEGLDSYLFGWHSVRFPFFYTHGTLKNTTTGLNNFCCREPSWLRKEPVLPLCGFLWHLLYYYKTARPNRFSGLLPTQTFILWFTLNYPLKEAGRRQFRLWKLPQPPLTLGLVHSGAAGVPSLHVLSWEAILSSSFLWAWDWRQIWYVVGKSVSFHTRTSQVISHVVSLSWDGTDRCFPLQSNQPKFRLLFVSTLQRLYTLCMPY